MCGADECCLVSLGEYFDFPLSLVPAFVLLDFFPCEFTVQYNVEVRSRENFEVSFTVV